MMWSDKFLSQAMNAYVTEHVSAPPAHLQHVESVTQTDAIMPVMLSGRVVGRLLNMLVGLMGAKRCLELGTYTGYATLSMAEALPPEGVVITCDYHTEHMKLAQKHFAQSAHGHKITQVAGFIKDTLPTIEGDFDFMFVDADKGEYPAYYEALVPRLKTGGLMVIDNTLWGGQVLQPEDNQSRGVAKLNDMIVADTRVENVLLTVRDGLQLIRKK